MLDPETLPPFSPTCVENFAPTAGGHSRAKSMCSFTLYYARLECSLHQVVGHSNGAEGDSKNDYPQCQLQFSLIQLNIVVVIIVRRQLVGNVSKRFIYRGNFLKKGCVNRLVNLLASCGLFLPFFLSWIIHRLFNQMLTGLQRKTPLSKFMTITVNRLKLHAFEKNLYFQLVS